MPFVLALLLLSALVHPARSGPQSLAPLSADARISVVTVLPGTDIHSLFGHTALRVHDPLSGLDEVYNYGTFDFSDPLFVPRFVYGQMDYFLSVHDFRRAVDHYRVRERRPVIVQELNLSREDVEAVYQRLRINVLPQNRVYRYDFFFDNCSTRPRDVLEEVLGPRLQYGAPPGQGRTFRRLLEPYIEPQPFLRAGINLLLGTPTDRPATPRETMFLPLDLFEMLDAATLRADLGAVPLVSRTDTVAWVEGYAAETGSLPWAMIVATLLLGAGLWWTIREVRTGRPAPTTFDASIFAMVGLMGIVICFMWFVSQHTVTAPNWNLAWAWPTHAVAAAFIRRERLRRGAAIYFVVTCVVTALIAAFWLVWPQHLPLAVLPLAVLVAVRSGALWMRYRAQPVRVAA